MISIWPFKKKTPITEPAGFILIDKPVGPSSHGVISRVRRISGVRRVGHAGTLDPLASGLMLVAISREYTKKLGALIKQDKSYVATIFLGASSSTYDQEGEKTTIRAVSPVSKISIKQALKKFTGEIDQEPPIFSAKKINGQAAYRRARNNEIFKLPTNKVTIYRISIDNYHWPFLKLTVNCSSGTYIRSLAHDLGQELGCGAYLYGLRRLSIGTLRLKEAIKLDNLNYKKLIKHLKTYV